MGALGGGITGAFSGLGSGAVSGGKGAKITDTIKNSYGSGKKRNEDWKSRGGYYNVVTGDWSDVTGTTRRQDKQMGAYQGQLDAIDAYDQAEKDYAAAVEQAQIDGIKGTTTGANDLFDMRGYGDDEGTMVQRAASALYSSGYESVELGDSASGYAQQMLEYDREYQDAQARLEIAKQGDDANAIAEAQAKLVEQRRMSEKRSRDYWESKKSSVDTSGVDSSKRDEARGKANKALGNAEGSSIDVKATRREIQARQKEIQGKRSYQATHRDK